MESEKILDALAQAGIAGVILGFVLWLIFKTLIPRLLDSFEHAFTKANETFRVEQEASRSANREEIRILEGVIRNLEGTLKEHSMAISKNTLETEKASHAISRFRSSVTNDLPSALHRALSTGDLPSVETIARAEPKR